jgi:predicted transcriptional regulator
MAEVNKISPVSILKLVISEKNLSLKTMAEKLNTTQQNLWSKTNSNSMKLKTFVDILEACDEELIITLKNGNKFKLEL